MKIEVQDCDYTYPKILMKTSIRGGKFSIRCQEKGVESPRYKSEIGYWPHLTVSQSKRLIKELRDFVNSEIVSRARYKHDIGRTG